MFAKNLKKMLALLMALAMVFTLFACAASGGEGGEGDDGDDSSSGGIFGERVNPLEGVDLSALSDEECMKTVEQATLKGAVGVLMEVLDAASQTSAGNTSMGAEMDITIRPGKELLNQLSSSVPTDMVDLSKLTSLGIDMNVAMKDDLTQTVMGLSVNGKKIADIDVIVDIATMTMWLGLPGLSSQYVMMDAGQMMPSGSYGSNAVMPSQSSAAVAMPQWVEMVPELMPDTEKLEPLLIKYIEIMLNKVDNIKRENVTINVDGVSQDVLQLTYTISEEDVLTMVIAVLEEMLRDAEVKALVDEFSEDANKIAREMGENSSIDLYPLFQDSVENAIYRLRMQLDDARYHTGNYILITTVLDNENWVVGRSFAMYTDGEEDFSFNYLTASDGTNQSLKMEFYTNSYYGKEGYSIKGSGTLKNGIVNNGTYTLAIFQRGQSMTLGSVELQNVTQNSGTFIIKPSAQITSEIFGSNKNVALKIALISSSKVTMELLMDNELFIGLDLTAKEKTVTSIKKPTNTVDGNDNNALYNWAGSLDLNKIIDKLNSTGVTDIPDLGGF